MMRRRLWMTVLMTGVMMGVLGAPAEAHEPLFGETPIVFGPGVIHPEAKFMYFDAGSTGRRGGERMRMFEQEYMVDYGISRYLNLRLEAPYLNNTHGENVGGRVQRTTLSGLGDIMLRAKYRFGLKQATGFQMQHSALFGIKLPTGASNHRFPNGARLNPSEQAGSGKPGFLLGYAWDRETIKDTLWASARWMRDVGGGFRRGDHLELDTAYGYWFKRANTPDELGIIVPIGLHAELAGSDRLDGGRSAGNGYRVAGLQLTGIATKGRNQYRIGVFVPLLRSGDPISTDYPVQIRAAFETFF
jgi:hypothetical protein